MLLGVVVLFFGIFKIFPIVKVLFVKLFNFFSCSIVVLYLFAMEYRVSPFWIVYVLLGTVLLGGLYGIFLYSRIDFITASANSL